MHPMHGCSQNVRFYALKHVIFLKICMSATKVAFFFVESKTGDLSTLGDAHSFDIWYKLVNMNGRCKCKLHLP